MWLLQIVNSRLGPFTIHLKEVAANTFVAEDSDDEFGARVSGHPSREAGLEAAIQGVAKLLGRSAQSPHRAPRTGLTYAVKTHMLGSANTAMTHARCGVLHRGRFTATLSEVTCGRCLRARDSSAKKVQAAPLGP